MTTKLVRLSAAAILAASLGAILAAGLALPGGAAAHGGENSTCADVVVLGIHVHGDHVIRDYVKGPDGEVGHGEGAALPGGPGAHGHFTVPGLAPGASFCNSQAHPNGFTTPPHF